MLKHLDSKARSWASKCELYWHWATNEQYWTLEDNVAINSGGKVVVKLEVYMQPVNHFNGKTRTNSIPETIIQKCSVEKKLRKMVIHEIAVIKHEIRLNQLLIQERKNITNTLQ
jgi:hypothetical protein